MAWKYWNPNPRSVHVGDCTIRAITRATGMSWDEAYANLAIYGLLQKNMPSANACWGAFLRSRGLKRKAIPDDKPDDYTVEDFCRDHPKGMFIVATEGHVLTVVDKHFFMSYIIIF